MTLKLELKIKDKVIKLTEQEARELGETLATMFDLKKTEWISYPWRYPWWERPYWKDWYITCTETDGTYTKPISNDVTATYSISG